jgi:hypothetical protein
MISDQQELFRFLAAPDIEVTNLLFAADKVMWVTWKSKEEEENIPVLRHTNEIIRSNVTTGAGLKPYTCLDALKDRAIYCDNDSIICIQKCGQPPTAACGVKLDDITNELGPGEYNEAFVSGGLRTTRSES